MEVTYVDLTNDNDDDLELDKKKFKTSNKIINDDQRITSSQSSYFDHDKKFKTTIKIIKDDQKIPLVMDILKPLITLADLKNSVRFKGLYQYFYKQIILGEESYRELISDSEIIPVFEDNIVEVKMFSCNDQQSNS